jgi:glycogen debranching enzyme
LGVLGYGDFEKVKENLNLLMKYQNIDGKIFHEITTSGIIHYDSADATPLFLIVFQKYVSCTGDYSFLEKNWDNFKAAVQFCFSTDSDKDHLIENTNIGHGWIEFGKLSSSHASLYLNSIWVKALQGGAILAKFMNEPELVKRWEEGNKEVLKTIDSLYWDEKTQYYALGINPSGEQLKFKTIMPSIPLYFKLTAPSKAHNMLIDFSSSKFSNLVQIGG